MTELLALKQRLQEMQAVTSELRIARSSVRITCE
jgi:hypothetical protein